MRELVLSPDRRFLYTIFGPSSGIVRIDLEQDDVHVLTVHGLSRYLWPDFENNEIVTVDWDVGDFLVFSADPFARARRVNLLEGKRLVR